MIPLLQPIAHVYLLSLGVCKTVGGEDNSTNSLVKTHFSNPVHNNSWCGSIRDRHR